MKKFLLLILLGSNLLGYTQDDKLRLLELFEDSLAKLRLNTLDAMNDSTRFARNDLFLQTFKNILTQDASFEFNFDDIQAIGDLRSPDGVFRMITWNVPYNNHTHKYFCLLQVHAKDDKDYALYELIDKSDEITRPLNKQLKHTEWYGALYSDIIVTKKKKDTYYTLLGWDGNDNFTTKKIIDVLYFTSSNEPRFGANIFKLSKGNPKRLIFEYSDEVTMSLKWEPKRKQIVFDHLSPTKEELKGIRQYYVPDMSFDALELDKGNWIYLHDVDVRMEKNKYDGQYNDPKELQKQQE